MIIFVKTPSRQTITFGHLQPENTMHFIKLLIYNIESRAFEGTAVPLLPDNMLLVYKGTTSLPDALTLREAGVPDRATLFVMPRLGDGTVHHRMGDAVAADAPPTPPRRTGAEGKLLLPPAPRAANGSQQAARKVAVEALSNARRRKRRGVRRSRYISVAELKRLTTARIEQQEQEHQRRSSTAAFEGETTRSSEQLAGCSDAAGHDGAHTLAGADAASSGEPHDSASDDVMTSDCVMTRSR
eukprot:g2950.t1